MDVFSNSGHINGRVAVFNGMTKRTPEGECLVIRLVPTLVLLYIIYRIMSDMQNVADIADIKMFKKSADFIDFFRNDSI